MHEYGNEDTTKKTYLDKCMNMETKKTFRRKTIKT